MYVGLPAKYDLPQTVQVQIYLLCKGTDQHTELDNIKNNDSYFTPRVMSYPASRTVWMWMWMPRYWRGGCGEDGVSSSSRHLDTQSD